jgi:SAM-dependent methyltransferase
VSTFRPDETIAYYRQKLAEHGPGARGMDWKDEASQRLRFDVIARYLDFARRPSILDVGCGSGAFLAYCREQGYDVDYLGLDICPEMAAACRERFGPDAAVEGQVDTLAEQGRQFDYVVASGTFNARLSAGPDEWRRHFHDSIATMFRLCRVGTVVNMMTSFVDLRYDRLYYATVDEMAELAVERLSRAFIIDHSYPLWEMTLAVYRSQRGPRAE